MFDEDWLCNSQPFLKNLNALNVCKICIKIETLCTESKCKIFPKSFMKQ